MAGTDTRIEDLHHLAAARTQHAQGTGGLAATADRQRRGLGGQCREGLAVAVHIAGQPPRRQPAPRRARLQHQRPMGALAQRRGQRNRLADIARAAVRDPLLGVATVATLYTAARRFAPRRPRALTSLRRPGDPPMSHALDAAALDQLFRTARTQNAFLDKPVPASLLQELYDLVKWGPTAANTTPARFVFVTSKEAKAKLAPALSEGNHDKTMAAPVTVLIGFALDCHEKLPYLFPHTDAKAWAPT
ncbi:hypothetical protein G6F31_015135 [Rhizopus arrhizus]|nr:hypothetical protein G6F31_015135 [Rhizopus arrhizus]